MEQGRSTQRTARGRHREQSRAGCPRALRQGWTHAPHAHGGAEVGTWWGLCDRVRRKRRATGTTCPATRARGRRRRERCPGRCQVLHAPWSRRWSLGPWRGRWWVGFATGMDDWRGAGRWTGRVGPERGHAGGGGGRASPARPLAEQVAGGLVRMASLAGRVAGTIERAGSRGRTSSAGDVSSPLGGRTCRRFPHRHVGHEPAWRHGAKREQRGTDW